MKCSTYVTGVTAGMYSFHVHRHNPEWKSVIEMPMGYAVDEIQVIVDDMVT